MYKTITLTESGGIGVLTLNRPKVLNALSLETVAELIDALDELRKRKTARALLLTGAGRAFCSGADLSPGAPIHGGAGRMIETHFNPLLERLFDLPMPFVAAVNGAAAGGGCSLALAADFVLAARSAYFLQAFVNIGLVPDVGATWVLPRQVGRARATAMMMLGERISAEDAASWGMIHRAVDDAVLQTEAMALAARLARGPTLAYSLIRKGIRRCAEISLTEALQLERNHQAETSRSADAAEGIRAFLEKRPADFRGH